MKKSKYGSYSVPRNPDGKGGFTRITEGLPIKDNPLSRRTISVLVQQKVYDVLDNMDRKERANLIRWAVTLAVVEKGLLPEEILK
jgi:hypothetical protein